LSHIPVLLKEVLEYLEVKPGGKYIDATFGAGGHSKAIAERGGEVLGIDSDERNVILSVAKDQKKEDSSSAFDGAQNDGRIKVVHGNFADIKRIAEDNGFSDVDGILFDLGLSSEQLDDAERGFSFQKDGPLDMRMHVEEAKTAADIVSGYQEKELVTIFYGFGEERRFGKRVARAIMDARKVGSIKSTAQLFDITKHALPANLRFRAGDTARRIFQALRIAVNGELANLEKALPQAAALLKPGGRLVVISFHSLEDRIVKNFMADAARDCVCPPEFPECRCDHRAFMRVLTRKPVTATEEEMAENSRSKSAKLRASLKI